MEGWIKLHRQIEENEFWFSEKFTRAQAWIDILLLARHKTGLATIRGVDIHLSPGQLCYSQKSLAKRWKWNVKTVNKFLSTLEKREMVDTRKNNITTIITIKKSIITLISPPFFFFIFTLTIFFHTITIYIRYILTKY